MWLGSWGPHVIYLLGKRMDKNMASSWQRGSCISAAAPCTAHVPLRLGAARVSRLHAAMLLRLRAARASMPPTAPLAPSHHRLAARAYCSSPAVPLAPTPRCRPRCSPLPAAARRSRRSRELSIRYVVESDSERATVSGYRYPSHLAG
jgi:hypothetical protein